jgi:hypothetical protein
MARDTGFSFVGFFFHPVCSNPAAVVSPMQKRLMSLLELKEDSGSSERLECLIVAADQKLK